MSPTLAGEAVGDRPSPQFRVVSFRRQRMGPGHARDLGSI